MMKERKENETIPETITGTTTARQTARFVVSRFLVACLLLCCLSPSAAFAQCQARNDAFKSGESIVYDLYFNWTFIWKRVGYATLNTQDTTYRQKKAYRFNLHCISSKQTDFYFKMRDTITSVVTENLEPIYYRKGAEEGKRYTVDEAWYSYANGKSHVKQKRTYRDKPAVETQYESDLCIFDMLSILSHARSYDPTDYKVGDKILFPMCTGKKVEEQTLIYRGIKEIEASDKKTYRCLVFSFVEYPKGKEKEVITFYISDDKNHLPIRLDMYLHFGSAKAFFKDARGLRHPIESVVQKKK